MANKINGVVEAVNRIEGPGGKWKKVSVKIKGQWYGGFINKDSTDDRASVKEGDNVEVEYVQSDRFLNIESIKVVAATETSKATAQQTQVQEYVPSSVRDLRITIAGARNTAIEFMRLALDNEVVTLKSTKGKKIDELLEHVNHFTEVFARQLLEATEVNLIGHKKPSNKAEAAQEDNEYTE